jgi:hypothetical protein
MPLKNQTVERYLLATALLLPLSRKSSHTARPSDGSRMSNVWVLRTCATVGEEHDWWHPATEFRARSHREFELTGSLPACLGQQIPCRTRKIEIRANGRENRLRRWGDEDKLGCIG